MSPVNDALEELHTVRDWLRFATSRFNAAGLSYGHGTSTALDEAAFLILETLHLPIDSLDPWLDARLTRAERQALCDIVERRIATRKPAAYLIGAAYIRGHRFLVDERTIVPRSYLGEMLCDFMDSGEPGFPHGVGSAPPDRILDLCTGGASLAILAALAFPDATIDALDVSPDALAVARCNVDVYDLSARIQLIESDLFSAVPGRTYDLIVSNPPYVTDAAVARFPAEHRAEPVLAHAGGADGLTLVRGILSAAAQHLAPGGVLLVETGQAKSILESAYPGLPFVWLETEASDAEVFALPAAALLAPQPHRKSGSKGTRRTKL